MKHKIFNISCIALFFISILVFIYTYYVHKIVIVERVLPLPIERIHEVSVEKEVFINPGVFVNKLDVNKIISFYQKNYPEDYKKILSFYDNYTKSRTITKAILKYCEEKNVPFHTGLALAKRETEFNPKSESKNSNGTWDRGLFSLNSSSHPKWKRKDYFDVDKNTKDAIGFLRWLLDTTENNNLALASYNAGYNKIKSKQIPYTTSIHVFTIKDFEYQFDIDFNTKLLPTLEHIEYSKNQLILEEMHN